MHSMRELFHLSLIFFYGGEHLSESFKQACNFLLLSDEKVGFVDILFSDRDQNIMTNSLSTQVESGSILYQNFNTNENFYSFLLAQQDETNSIIPKRVSYSYCFEKYVNSYLSSISINDTEKDDLFSNKNSKYLFYKFNSWRESMEGEKLLIRHTAKTKDDFSLKTIESKDRHFLIEKLMYNIKLKDHYANSTDKNPEIIETVENNHKVIGRVYQSLFLDIAESFFEYIHSLDPDEIQELDSNVKANDSGVKYITEIQDAHHLLTIFQMFYYLNGRLTFTNELIIVFDWEVPADTEKINLENLHQICRDTKSHGIVSLHFLCSLGMFFGLWSSIAKYALTELYKNLSSETLSGARNHEFDSVSDLIGELSFFIKQVTLANIKGKEEEDKTSIREIEKTRNFVEKNDEFSEEVTDGLFKDLEHKKTRTSTCRASSSVYGNNRKENKKIKWWILRSL